MEDLQFEAEFLTWDHASQNTFVFACHLTSTLGIKVSWDPFHPDWIASVAKKDVAQATMTTQHLGNIQRKDKYIRAQTMEVSVDGKHDTMQDEGGETFVIKIKGQDTRTGYPTLREAIQRTFPTRLRLFQLTEPDRIYSSDDHEKGKKQITWAQARNLLRARLQELKDANPHSRRKEITLEAKPTELDNGKQVFITIRLKLIGL